MACPHVSGLAAIMYEAHPTAGSMTALARWDLMTASNRTGWITAIVPATPATVNLVALAPTAAPTPSPPTPSPTLSPTTNVVSGAGDPHLSNMRGEHFDVYQLGKMALIHVPRLAEPAHTLLLVEADARIMGGVCSIYFQVLSISGLWTNQSKPVEFFANPHGTPEGRKWKEWMRFGPIDLKVTHQKKGVDFLNVFARNVDQSGYEVGGLLGLDDHREVAKRPSQCAHRHIAAFFSVAEAK